VLVAGSPAACIVASWAVLALAGGCSGHSDAPPPPPPKAAEAPRPPDAEPPLVPGRWNELRQRASVLSAEQQATIERLEAVGYLAGSNEPKGGDVLTAYDPERAFNGTNFFVSGHGPVAYLADMTGAPLHRWMRAYADVWPELPHAANAANEDFWRRAVLLENGDVLAIFSGLGIIKIDKDSNVLWARHNGAHHDLQVVEGGDIYLLTRVAHVRPDANATEPILEDFITVLDADGNEKRRVSIYDCFLHSAYAELGLRRVDEGGDIFHTNTLYVLPADRTYTVPWLRPGYILTSLRSTSLLAVIDLDAATVVKAWRGSFRRQHDPSWVAGGRILLFDNTGPGTRSRVMELDPATFGTVWEYRGLADDPLRSWTCGAAERLPNGNTLITDSDQGRAIEVTREGDVVWEFYNPFRIGQDPVLIATLFELVRIPAGFPLDWLAEGE
jgi:hypothetical protein